ncbi:MAG: BlaI/MecI/CopY family transcriptional regulator [Blastocatellia bacterium]
MARKKNSEQLTPLELDIMKVLWEAGPATVQAVQQRLPEERKLAYTTVQTMLNVLHRKGKVKRRLKNRAYHYQPVVTRRQVAGQAIGDIVNRLFGGSAESLVMSMIEHRHLTHQKLAKLNKLLDEAKEARDGND